MIEYLFQYIGGIIGVFEFLLSSKAVGIGIHINIHRVLDPLLPSAWLGFQ
jgi:hypothetical protein